MATREFSVQIICSTTHDPRSRNSEMNNTYNSNRSCRTSNKKRDSEKGENYLDHKKYDDPSVTNGPLVHNVNSYQKIVPSSIQNNFFQSSTL